MKHCRITIKGNNNKVIISKRCNLNNMDIAIEDDSNMIILGEHVTITGHTHIAAIEGTRVSIGHDCLLSSDITFRTGDSHSILNAYTGERMNSSEDITIGDHVWIGHKATILKGTSIGNHSIVATGAIVAGKNFQDNCIIGGVPARVIREGIDWCAERIKIITS